MPIIPEGQNVFIQPAEVIAVYEESRIVDVKWVGMEGTKRDVVIVSESGSYSMPKPGDRGLVLGTGIQNFFLGRIDFRYAAKIEGKIPDKTTGQTVTYRKVAQGDIHITNPLKKIWMRLVNSGDFSLSNGFLEGFRYFRNLRLTSVVGKTVEVAGNGIKLAIGTAIRDVPSVGPQPVLGTSGGKSLEALLQIAYQGVQTVRFHMGEITDLISGTVPELSAWGPRLKALLEVTVGAVKFAYLHMDELGNIELKSVNGIIAINGGLPAGGILLGSPTSTVHPAMFGDLWLLWAKTHIHPSSMGPTGIAAPQATTSMNSTKVLLS